MKRIVQQNVIPLFIVHMLRVSGTEGLLSAGIFRTAGPSRVGFQSVVNLCRRDLFRQPWSMPSGRHVFL